MSVFDGGTMLRMSGRRKLEALSFAIASVLLLYLATASVTYAQGERAHVPEWWAFYSEAQARWDAHKVVMPEYPEEAVRQGIAGIVEIIIGTDKYGRVAKIKIQPGVDPLLTRAVVKAVKQWTFNPHPAPDGSNRYMISRLTFSFVINFGENRVEMYTPAAGERSIGERLNDTSGKEPREWEKWEQAWARPPDPPRER